MIEALVTSGQSARLLQDLFATATYDHNNFVAHEAKVGKQTNRSRLRDELDKDCALLARADGRVVGVVWHFYGSKPKPGKYRLGRTEACSTN